MTVAQIAPVIPYLLLVLILISAADRPARDARHMSEVAETAAIEASAGARFALLRRYGIWLAAVLLVIGLPLVVPLGHRADHDEPDGHHDHLRAVLQHAARPDRHAVVRPRGVLRPRRVLRRACDERDHPRQVSDPASGHSAGRRCCRARVRRHLRIGLDPARRHRLRDDLARPRRARRVELAHPAQLLRRRGRHHHQPHAPVSASSTGISARRSRSTT